MKGHMRICPNDHTYTLSEVCPVCGCVTKTPHPYKFSPHNRFIQYLRRS